jgi:hypothetical protein
LRISSFDEFNWFIVIFSPPPKRPIFKIYKVCLWY